MNKIKIFIADDHTIVRKGIIALLQCEEDIEIVGEGENGRSALYEIDQVIPDVVLMDISMPLLNGIEATRQLKKRFPELKVIILTMHSHEEYILKALKAGASGYLVKKTLPRDLITAIHAVHRGGYYLSPSISKKVIDPFINQKPDLSDQEENYKKLTSREREVLQLIAEGYPNRKMAEIMCISSKTVEAHKIHIQEKLKIHGTAELTKFAVQKGLVSLDY